MSTHTVFSDDAQRCATTDRHRAADLVLNAAVRDATKLIRRGRIGYAEFILVRAGRSAARILGEPQRRDQ